MDNDQAIAAAGAFLGDRKIRFAQPATVVTIGDASVIVIFPIPEALDPNVVVDPPDVRVLINTKTGSIELVPQM